MALTWDARTMATGIEEIDAQHRELIDHLNQFFRLMQRGEGGEGLGEFMDFLAEYTAGHFRHEEACMAVHRCPAAAANKHAHTNFLRIFQGYRKKLEANGPTTVLVIEVQREISSWIRNHLVRTDAQLRECVRAEVC